MKKLAFFSTQFENGSPAQHLLDRCLTGWPSEGRFIESPFSKVSVHGSGAGQNLEHREEHPNLKIEENFDSAIEDADAWILAAGANDNLACCSQYLYGAVERTTNPTRGFIAGFPAGLGTDRFNELMLTQGNRILVSTPLPLTWRLPEVDTPAGAILKEAVVLIRGPFPTAEQEAVDALLALTSHRKDGESSISKISQFAGDEIWRAAKEGHFSWDLFSTAVSRTNSKQGDATIDGRTQDIVGLGMVPQLAKGTRAWILEHLDGLKSTIITMDGILNDDNFAVKTGAGDVISAQFYRPPKPNDHQYSRMMDRISSFLVQGENPLDVKRTLLWANIIKTMQEMKKMDLSSIQPNFNELAYNAPESMWKP